jgi:hypothetical protein
MPGGFCIRELLAYQTDTERLMKKLTQHVDLVLVIAFGNGPAKLLTAGVVSNTVQKWQLQSLGSGAMSPSNQI